MTSLLLGIEICNDRIGLSLAKLPSETLHISKLNPIPYRTRHQRVVRCSSTQKKRVCEKINSIVQNNDVAGFVVGWPLQPDGHPGAPCGRVLHLLDYFAEKQEPFLHIGRPFALWDVRSIFYKSNDENYLDEWGRSSLYCQTPGKEKNMYKSRLQYKYETSDDSLSSKILLEHYLNYHFYQTKDSKRKLSAIQSHTIDQSIHLCDKNDIQVHSAVL
mmetsp:Transcript_10004/g.14153  ORF Transcript_10004/g.14153 Transcript_10004/m.14153 type:complete len:216 (-) Transcript_10004:564-1211(-)